jgi:hypothetical protein
MIVFASGCSRELRDAAVSAAATFVEQQTLTILNEVFGVGTSGSTS